REAGDSGQRDVAEKPRSGAYVGVPSGGPNRHVGAVADHIVEDLEKAGLPDVRIEGQPHCDWVLIDAGDVIVHVFRPEVRTFYNLEKMWASGRPSELRPS